MSDEPKPPRSVKATLAALGIAAVATTSLTGCFWSVGNPAPAPYDAGTDAGTDAGPAADDAGPDNVDAGP